MASCNETFEDINMAMTDSKEHAHRPNMGLQNLNKRKRVRGPRSRAARLLRAVKQDTEGVGEESGPRNPNVSSQEDALEENLGLEAQASEMDDWKARALAGEREMKRLQQEVTTLREEIQALQIENQALRKALESEKLSLPLR